MISTFGFCFKKATCSCIKSYSTVREARMLQKMINKGFNTKKPAAHGKKIITKGILSSPYDNEYCNHKMTALNKVYMENICMMIHNKEYGRKLADLKVEVTKVKISKDFNYLNIYFITRETDISEELLEETLSKVLTELQVQMGEVKYIGKVPYLKFVRDKRLENAVKLEKIFQVMDLGKDFQTENLKKVVTQDSSKPDTLPEMRQDVFGIDVARITRNIKASIIRYKVVNIEANKDDFWDEPDSSHKLMQFTKKDFVKFYKRRRIAELKRRKMEERERGTVDFDFEYDPQDIYESQFELVDDEDYVRRDDDM